MKRYIAKNPEAWYCIMERGPSNPTGAVLIGSGGVSTMRNVVAAYAIIVTSDEKNFDSFYKREGCKSWIPLSKNKALSPASLRRELESSTLIEVPELP